MSVLIKGMEMPKDDKAIHIEIHRDGTAIVWCYGESDKIVGKAIPVPPHGRLIDADALDVIGYCGIPQGREDTFDDGMMWLAEQIDLLPTIIPASDE